MIQVKDGEDSDAWKSALETMDLLISSVEPKDTPEERRKLVTIVPELLKRLSDGLKIAGIEDAVRLGFFAEMRKLHSEVIGKTERPKATAPLEASIADNAAQPELPPVEVPSVELPLVAEIALAPMEAIRLEPTPPAEPAVAMPPIDFPSFDLPLVAAPASAPMEAVRPEATLPAEPAVPVPPFDLPSFELPLVPAPASAPEESVRAKPTLPAEPAVPMPSFDLPSFDLPLVPAPASASEEAVRPKPTPPAEPAVPMPPFDLPSFDLPVPAPAPKEAVRPDLTPPAKPAVPMPPFDLPSFDLPLVPAPASAPRQAVRPVPAPAAKPPAPTPPVNRPVPSETKAANPAPLDFTAAVTINNPFGQGEVQVDDLDFTAQLGGGSARAKRDAVQATLPANLTPGTWVAIQAKGEKDSLRLAKLSFVSPLKSRYLFVDRHGKTTLECSRSELARRFQLGEVVITKEVSEPPLFDRLAQGLVGKLGGPKAPR